MLSQNNSITPANAIYLQTLAIGIGEFSEEQLSSLLDIASQCPQDGGDGVYRARSLYAYSYPDFIFNDAECEAIEFRNSKMNSTLEMVNFTLKPNPANTTVLLKFLNDFEFEAQVKIINLLGEIVSEHEKSIDGSNLTLDLSKLGAGIYFVQVWSNGKVVSSKKLSITK